MIASQWFKAMIGAMALSAIFCGIAKAGEIEHHSFQSAILNRSFEYSVYRPTPAVRNTRYPVLYLLHGAGGDAESWSRHGRIREVADRLIASGALRPMIIVMPGAGECWWVDTSACKIESAFWQELEPIVAARSDVMSGRGARSVAGVSAGGYGALRQVLTHPERFSVAALLSPAIYADTPPERSKARSNSAFLDADGGFDATLWQSRNYPRLLAAYREAKFAVPLYITVGDRDVYGLASEASRLHQLVALHQNDDVQLRILDGDHNWQFWSRINR